MSLSDIVRASRERAAQAAAEARLELEPEGQRVLLVYLFAGLGDVVLLAPVAKALLDRGARVGVLVRPLGARVLARSGLRLTRHVLAADASARDARALEKQLTGARYDVGVDLTHRGDVDARRWLVAEHRLGWRDADETTAGAGLHASAADVRVHADRHWSRASMTPLAPLGVDAPAFDVPWRSTPAADAWARAQWGRGPRVLVIPGSRSADKQWRSWPAVARALVETHRARVVVSGAPWEAESMRAIADPLGAAGRLFTGKDLARLLALIRSADLVLSNDTGPMHWAFAVGTPTVALFLHMAPESWGPPRPSARHVTRRVAPDGDEAEVARWVFGEASRLLAAKRPRR